MNIETVVHTWFTVWEEGTFLELPLAKNFKHTSPYGVIDGKQAYIDLVVANKDKFLGHRFEIHDVLYSGNKACVRYTAIQGDFRLEVSEWHIVHDNLIQEVIAYYNIEGEISENRTLKNMP